MAILGKKPSFHRYIDYIRGYEKRNNLLVNIKRAFNSVVDISEEDTELSWSDVTSVYKKQDTERNAPHSQFCEVLGPLSCSRCKQNTATHHSMESASQTNASIYSPCSMRDLSKDSVEENTMSDTPITPSRLHLRVMLGFNKNNSDPACTGTCTTYRSRRALKKQRDKQKDIVLSDEDISPPCGRLCCSLQLAPPVCLTLESRVRRSSPTSITRVPVIMPAM